jgi:hypothetical protein
MGKTTVIRGSDALRVRRQNGALCQTRFVGCLPRLFIGVIHDESNTAAVGVRRHSMDLCGVIRVGQYPLPEEFAGAL